MSNINLDVTGTKVTLEPITAQTFSLTVPSAVPAVVTALATGPQGPAQFTFHGQMTTQTQQTVDIIQSSVYTPMNITGTFDTAVDYGMSAPTTATFGLKNTSGRTSIFFVIASADTQVANNRTVGLRLAKNGTGIVQSTCVAQTGNHNLAKVLTQFLVELADGDEVSMLLADIGSAQDITVDRAKIVAFSVSSAA